MSAIVMDVDCYQNLIPNGHLVDSHKNVYVKPIRVEICQSSRSKSKPADLEEEALGYLIGEQISLFGDTVFSNFEDPFLAQNVQHITVSGSKSESRVFGEQHLDNLDVCIYRFQNMEPFTETLEDDVSAANTWMLPSPELHGLWENLYYEDDIKENLLEYMKTTLLFSDSKVDSNVVSWNRLVLLHGPPGTGKTSLCRALAHKVSIVLSKRYKFGQLLEINSHSLFSKWFSESGKLVLKMFQKIEDIVSDPKVLVCVLIDEVESLTSSRQLMSANEPTESIRVVNALLTQLDLIKRHPNVLILTTSNMANSIDCAFLDRADIRQYVGLPSKFGIYEIFYTCIQELMKAGIIRCSDEVVLDRRAVQVLVQVDKFDSDAHPLSYQLLRIAESCMGLSGRTLRKLPFLAHALFLQKPCSSVGEFLTALSRAVQRHFEEDEKNKKLNKNQINNNNNNNN